MLFYSLIILGVADLLAESHTITQEQLTHFYNGIMPWIILIHVVIHLIVSIVMLFVSHRIAGPLERFKQVMRALLKDDYFHNGFNTRKNDYFDDIKVILNDINNKMRKDYLFNQNLISSCRDILADSISRENRNKIEKIISEHEQKNIIDKQ